MNSRGAEKELRIGLVLYGGVSLCIYIYGVVYEFLRLARKQGPYKELAKNAGVDPVIDIISGTSAGGINGLFLAKAVATGADLSVLKDLWISEGDLEKLIDEKSRHPLSLLDSRNYERLLENALNSMKPVNDGGPDYIPDFLDLFITATDLDGIVHHPLIDAIGTKIYTKSYGTVFHFQKRPEHAPFMDRSENGDKGNIERDDFGRGDHNRNKYLAKVAAATSSFPVAFAPVSLEKQDKTEMRECFGPEMFQEELDDLEPSVYGDGGMVDNKPFGYTIQTIFRRRADKPVDRKLFYIEPDPAVHRGKKRLANSPSGADGIDSLIAFMEAKMFESITCDLNQIEQRNEKIVNVRQMLDSLKKAVKSTLSKNQKDIREYLKGTPLYYDYMQLKAEQVKKRLRSDLSALRNASGEQHQSLIDSEVDDRAHFLMDFDFIFRIRRIRSMIDQINDWLRGLGEKMTEDVFEKLRYFKTELYKSIGFYLRKEREIFADNKQKLDDDFESGFSALRADFRKVMQDERQNRVKTLVTELEDFRKEKDLPCPAPLTGVYEKFEFLDMYIFPIQILADIAEADPIEVIRVSPNAATRYKSGNNLVAEKLAGEKFMHFSAFLKRSWRENDIIWGRLDAAEIIARTLLPNPENAGIVSNEAEKLLDQICPEIIKEEMTAIRERRKAEIDAALFTGCDQRKIKDILDDKDGLNVEDTEDYFRSNYNVGQEGIDDIPASYMIQILAKGLRTFGRLLNRLPSKSSIFGSIIKKPVGLLSLLFELLYWILKIVDKIGCFCKDSPKWCCYGVLIITFILLIVIIF